MKVFKTRVFSKWTKKEKIADIVLINAINIIDNGGHYADLGGNVFKLRITLGGKGK